MEEHVGQLWNRWVTRLAVKRHPAAAVRLGEVARAVGVLFRALGGPPGLRIEAAEAVAGGFRRDWLQRLAGTAERQTLARVDGDTLRLPGLLDCLPRRELNRDLYLWLAAMAAVEVADPDWFRGNQARARAVLEANPGLVLRYGRLLAAHLPQRPALERLRGEALAQERALRAALAEPGRVPGPLAGRGLPAPVPLWLAPALGRKAGGAAAEGDPEPGDARSEAAETPRRRAERVASRDPRSGLLSIRWDNVFSTAEHMNIDRPGEDEDDLGAARKAAEDLDVVSVTRDRRGSAARLRLDLDLPADGGDDRPIDAGLPLPEWDWRSQRLLPGVCRAQTLVPAESLPTPLPERLRRPARRLRREFEALRPARLWRGREPEGEEIDLDAVVRLSAERRTRRPADAGRLYRASLPGAPSLACLVMADLSLSTDAYVDNQARVIDVIRDALLLLGESLHAVGDRFALYGFSSVRGACVRIHQLKAFTEPYDDAARGRIASIRPGFYTRMGAALRHATQTLAPVTAARRLLLLLTDGKPNDLDHYEGRYGVEDTRAAVREARRAGLQPFCVTIDEHGQDYLPHLFGVHGFVTLRDARALPLRLPRLYAQLTR